MAEAKRSTSTRAVPKERANFKALLAKNLNYFGNLEAAQKAVFPAVQANAWLLFDTGKAKVSPDTVGIPKP